MLSTIRAVAFFEAFKGIVVMVAATRLLSLLHKDVFAIAAALIEHLHLNPAWAETQEEMVRRYQADL
jgi:hypothetical protein